MTTDAAATRDAGGVAVLIALAATTSLACFLATADKTWAAVSAHPAVFVSFLALTLLLQAIAVDVYGRGRISVAGIGLLAVGFSFGVGAAMAVGVLAAAILGLRTRADAQKVVFNAATFSLAAGAATGTYELLASNSWTALERLAPALVAGGVFWAVNIGLLCFVMSLSEGIPVLPIWRERFRWLTAHYVAFGPLGLASVFAYDHVGMTGLVAFVVPPALLIVSTRQYLERTREAVEEVRTANDELRRTNSELAARNEDLQELLGFASGLASRAHDRAGLLAYAEQALERLVGAEARIQPGRVGPADGIPLVAGGTYIASLSVGTAGQTSERWERLREAILPQLATALESAQLVDEVRKTHLDTIAALSRSMEAKDYYTGGHTERVAELSVALAQKLGYAGADLDAVEIGALLHDIGKIGIPERILHKPGPLDAEEWRVMKEHPVISDYILSDVDLHPIVKEIARSSHERIDGTGYPDRLAGDAIPLAARIVLVADAFDALTSDRPYRHGRDARAALAELRANAGTQFCPHVVAALEELAHEQPELVNGAATAVA